MSERSEGIESNDLLSVVKKPKGRIPVKIKEWMDVNNECHWCMCVCSKCGKWYQDMDRLAPYHFEMCYCKECGYEEDSYKDNAIVNHEATTEGDTNE